MNRSLVALTVLASCTANFAAGQVLDGSDSEPITNFEIVRAEKVYRAVRANAEIRIDGIINEAAWEEADWEGDFYQDEPVRGARATEDGGSPHSLDRKSPALRWIAAAQK